MDFGSFDSPPLFLSYRNFHKPPQCSILSNNNTKGNNVWQLANKGYLKFGPVAEMFFRESKLNSNFIPHSKYTLKARKIDWKFKCKI